MCIGVRQSLRVESWVGDLFLGFKLNFFMRPTSI